MARITKQSSIHTTGVSFENEPIIKSDGAGEVMQWQPSDGAADGIFITENSAGDPLRMGVGTDAPKRHLHIYNPTDTGSGVGQSTYIQVTNLSTGKSTDGKGFQIGLNNAGEAQVNQRENLDMIFSTNNVERLRISSAGTTTITPTGNVKGLYFPTSPTTTDNVIQVDADSLTDGRMAYFKSNASSTNTRSLVYIKNDNPAATGTTGFEVRNDSTGLAIYANGGGIVERDGVLKSNQISNSGFDVWSNSTLEDATGTELVTNGTFASDLTGWTTTATGSATVAQSGGAAVLTDAAASVCTMVTTTAYPTVVGKLYKASFLPGGVTSGSWNRWFVGTTQGASDIFNSYYSSGWASKTATQEFVFEATTTTAFFYFENANDAGAWSVDNVSLKEATPKCIATNPLAPDGWEKSTVTDLSRISHNTSNIKGMYGCHMLTGSTNAEEIYQPSASAARGEQSWYNKFRGRTVTFGCWLYADSTASNGARAYIRDQDGSSFATQVAADTLTWVEVTRTISTTAWSSTAQYVQLGVKYECGSALKNCYVSQPILAYGSAIGAGNYSRPSGEVIWCEKAFASNKFNANGFSDIAGETLNLEADTNGKFPKGAKAVSFACEIKDSASATTDSYFYMKANSTSGVAAWVSCAGLANDKFARETGTTPCGDEGDFFYRVEATGSATTDIYLNYTGVQLR